MELSEPYERFLSDDSLISYRYAERLATGHGLTWTEGEAVEGYSNLAWVLLLAAWRALGGDLVSGGRILGFTCSGITLAALAFAFRPRKPRESVAPLAAPFALATATPFVVWAGAGLEQPLLGTSLALAAAFAFEDVEARTVPRWRQHALGASLALACWTRPDAPLFAATLGLTWALVRSAAFDRWRALVVVAAWPIAAVLGQLVFRIVYYQALVPNTARAKIGLTPERLAAGEGYVFAGLTALGSLVVFVVVAFVLGTSARSRLRRLAIVGVPGVAWLAYLARIGGDIFPAHRHFVPIVVLGGFAFADVLLNLTALSRRGVIVAIGLGVFVPTSLAARAEFDGEARRAVEERWEWDGQRIGSLLRRAFRDRDPLLAVDPAGCVPYFSGLRSLDMLGLNDRFLAEHPPESFGRGWLGHELGNGDYVLGRRPELVLFCSPVGREAPCFLSGHEMVRDPRFREDYRLVSFESPGDPPLTSLVYVRTIDGTLGARDVDGRVQLPAFVFAGSTGRARLEGDRLVGSLPADSRTEAVFALPRAGRYAIELDADDPSALVVTSRSAQDPSATIVVDGSRRLELSVAATRDVVLRGLALVPLR